MKIISRNVVMDINAVFHLLYIHLLIKQILLTFLQHAQLRKQNCEQDGHSFYELNIVMCGSKKWGHLNQIQIRLREGVLEEETQRMDWRNVPGISMERKA